MIRIELQDFDFARGAWPQALENFDRGRLAGAIRSQQSEDFPGTNFEVDTFDRFEAPVGLAKPAHVNGKFVVQAKTSRSGRDE